MNDLDDFPVDLDEFSIEEMSDAGADAEKDMQEEAKDKERLSLKKQLEDKKITPDKYKELLKEINKKVDQIIE